MAKKTMLIMMIVLILIVALSSIIAYAGGDKNTNRGSEGEQIGEPSPDPLQNPDQTRTGDPNPDMENVPDK